MVVTVVLLPAPKPNNFIKLFGFFIALKMINPQTAYLMIGGFLLPK
ncbi:hypothetical protein EA1_04762 [Moraxella catarrhalis O35E]|nr:hypothetical protein EA1_04762 [Moraxella catarrhalis O35E]